MNTKPEKSAAKSAVAKAAPAKAVAGPLLTDLRGLIQQAREQVARTVNTGLILLYWHVGTRIRRDLLNEQRAEYGKLTQSFTDIHTHSY